jgi:hypothetical protein
MEAALYVSLLLVFFLSRAAASMTRTRANALSEAETPAWVLREARQSAQEARIRWILVEMGGDSTLPSHVQGETTKGNPLLFIVNSIEEVLYERGGEAYRELPKDKDAARQIQPAHLRTDTTFNHARKPKDA